MTISKSSKPVGLLLDHLGHYQWQLFRPIRDVLNSHGLPMISFLGYELETIHEEYRHANEVFDLANPSNISSLITFDSISHFISDDKLLKFLKSCDVSGVFVGRNLPGFPSVSIEQHPGMHALMRHLLDERGFKRLAFVRGWPDNHDSCLRETIFCQELAARGLPTPESLRITGRFYSSYAETAMKNLLDQGESFDAVVAANDSMARGVIKALHERGFKVPDDVAVVGFDDEFGAAYIEPPLTTVRQPIAALGESAAQLLVSQIQGQALEPVNLSTHLVVRASCGSMYEGDETKYVTYFEAAQQLSRQRNRMITLMDTGHEIWHQNNIEEFFKSITTLLPTLNIKTCHIVLYQDATAYLALAYGSERSYEGRHFTRGSLLPEGLQLDTNLHQFVLPLFTPEETYGHLILGIGQFLNDYETLDEFEMIYRSLRRDISKGLQVIKQRQEIAAYTTSLEEKVRERTRELEYANEELARLATIDGLTGINNRAAFDTYLSQQWTGHGRMNAPLSLILCDVDHFKLYNDHYGHLQGDSCLKAIAGVLKTHVRYPYDSPTRYGGEEFALLLPQTNEEGALKVANRILNAVHTLALPHAASPTHKNVTLSIGVYTLKPGSNPKEDSRALISGADQALYNAKRAGRNRLVQMLSDQLVG